MSRREFVENWGSNQPAKIRTSTKSSDIRQGIVRRANGVNALVVWMELNTTKPLEVTISQ